MLGELYRDEGQDGSLESDCSPPGFDFVVPLSSRSKWPVKDNDDDHAIGNANDHAIANANYHAYDKDVAACLQLPFEVKFATLVTTLTLKSNCQDRVQNGKVRGTSGGSRISERQCISRK